MLERHAGELPGLAAAARTVASRQVRNRATLAGALVLGDPSCDALAALGAAQAEVEIHGPDGRRTVAADAFVTAPGACDLRPDELVTALLVPVADGPVAYAKAGARNAMARAVCAVAIALHPSRRTATACVVGAAPTAIRPSVAEALVAACGTRSATRRSPSASARWSPRRSTRSRTHAARLPTAGRSRAYSRAGRCCGRQRRW